MTDSKRKIYNYPRRPDYRRVIAEIPPDVSARLDKLQGPAKAVTVTSIVVKAINLLYERDVGDGR